jgi:lipopolysaccharide/colanic/teichoic acid biosynthesis glycosyltransferase
MALLRHAPAMSLGGSRSPAWQHRAKRGEDIVIAALLLVILALPMLLIALLIRIDSPGPALFRQQRTGFGGRTFCILKFRTMHFCPAATEAATRQATRHDPRVTRVGTMLRRTSLDELPQLFNVLRGDMSMVGPRPHAPGTCAGGRPFEEITPSYMARHCVRPGLTGLAQVRGLRGETETEDKLVRRLEADLEYIETWSLRLDFAVLAQTVIAVLCMRNAY